MLIQMDTSKTGLEMFFKPWQVQALNHLQAIHPEGATCLSVYKVVNQTTKISRASIFNFLNASVDDGLMTYTETTGRGGQHRVYTP